MVRTLDEAKRTAILAAAKTTFIKDGVAAAKMSDIAAEAGVAPGTLYLYFENKEALASAIGEEFFARLVTQFVAMIQKIQTPDDLYDLIEWASGIADEDRQLLKMVKERAENSKSRDEGRKRFVSHLAEPLNQLMKDGVIRQYANVNVLAELVLALMRRIIMSNALFHDDNLDELKEGTVAMLQHALFDDVTVAANKLVKRNQSKAD